HPRGAAGNGALMRSAPTAVLYAQSSLEESMEAAHQLAAITHGDPAAGWGSALYHAMIHAAMNGRDPFAELPALLATLPNDQTRYRHMLSPDWRPTDGDLPNGSVWGCLAQAVLAVRGSSSFDSAM